MILSPKIINSGKKRVCRLFLKPGFSAQNFSMGTDLTGILPAFFILYQIHLRKGSFPQKPYGFILSPAVLIHLLFLPFQSAKLPRPAPCFLLSSFRQPSDLE